MFNSQINHSPGHGMKKMFNLLSSFLVELLNSLTLLYVVVTLHKILYMDVNCRF